MQAYVTRRSALQWTGVAAFALPVRQFDPDKLEIRRMAFTPKFVDLVRNIATVTGTGPVTLGTAVNGYSSLAAAVAAGEQFYYCLQGIDKPAEREIGRGTMQADGRVARQAIAGALTNFTGGTKTIALVAAAEWFATLDQLATGAAAGVASRTELAARPAEAAAPLLLGEQGREGLFQFDSGDLSAKVSADAAQGIYVPPASAPTGASGAWVRKFDGPVNPLWFGISTANSGAENDAALLALFATLRARSASIYTTAQATEPILFPAGTFNFNSTIELTDGCWHIKGAGANDASGTILKFPAGVTGIRSQAANTAGATGTRAPGRTAFNSIVEDLVLTGAYTAGEAEAHGIHMRVRLQVRNVIVRLFEGDGVHIRATSGDPTFEGNANLFRLDTVRSINCRNGFFINGADVNAGVLVNCDGSSNRQWGFWDSSFLGNSYIACHSEVNGRTTGALPTACSHGGNRYYVKAGQEAAASTNAPSGTTADNSWWGYIGAGGASITYPAWASGTAFREGGAYKTDNANACNVLTGCYSESGQNPAQLVQPTLVLGGLHGAGIKGTGAWLRSSQQAGAAFADAFRTSLSGASLFRAGLGEQNLQTAVFFDDSVAGPAGWRLKLNGNDVQFDYAGSNSHRAFLISGPSTAQQFGTGAAVPHAFYAPHFCLGDDGENVSNGRRVMVGTAAPTSGTHAQGEIMFNRVPASGQPMGWVCSVAGTPGTWLPLANVP